MPVKMPLPTDSTITKNQNIYMQLWGKKQPQNLTVENKTTKHSTEHGKAIEAYLALMCIRRVWRDEDGQASTVTTWMWVPTMGFEKT